jgi:hypothetical protein
MMQKPETFTEAETIAEPRPIQPIPVRSDVAPGRRANLWVARITTLIGLACLVLALVEWAIRPNHYRLVLALLVIAMFAAILHSYTFENGG